jgi:hypothetical protein
MSLYTESNRVHCLETLKLVWSLEGESEKRGLREAMATAPSRSLCALIVAAWDFARGRTSNPVIAFADARSGQSERYVGGELFTTIIPQFHLDFGSTCHNFHLQRNEKAKFYILEVYLNYHPRQILLS